MRRRRTRVTWRQREARRRRRRRLCIAAAVAMLAVVAMAPQLRGELAAWARRGLAAVPALIPRSGEAQVTLPERRVYALQLGVFDSGERAQTELQRLTDDGVPCVIWQREQMRIVCDAACAREALDVASPQGREAYVIGEALPEVVLRVEAQSGALGDVRTLLLLPDELLSALSGEEVLTGLLERTRSQAVAALHAHPEHELYTQLAQSLCNWCALIEGTLETQGEAAARSYARVTVCTLCYELRRTLIAQSEESTASAQRTPSTAAEVMPPA